MFEFFKKKKSLPIIVAIHGFGKRRTDQLVPLKNYFEKAGYPVVCPILFDASNPDDTDPMQWMKRASDCVDELLAQKKEIILVGFSMGGVIAASLAASYTTSKLILLAPAFSYLTIGNVASTVTKLFESDSSHPLPDDEYVPLPASFTTTFRSIVDQHRDDITKVRCPILIFHGMEDETIPYSSSRKIIKKISHPHRALVLLNEAGHHLLDNPLNSHIVLETARSFIENRL